MGTTLRGLGYYGYGASDVDTLETHWTHIVANDQCRNEQWGDFVMGPDTICVEDNDHESICGDEQLDGALCYPYCASGYYGVGPVCWEYCASGYDDHGATCFSWTQGIYGKKSYGRTAGAIPNYDPNIGKQQTFGAGDSGSPVIFVEDGRQYQIALVSGVRTDENKVPFPFFPAVLTSVSHFYDWIFDAAIELVNSLKIRQYSPHEGQQCVGTGDDILRDFEGTVEECERKCDELICIEVVTFQVPLDNEYMEQRVLSLIDKSLIERFIHSIYLYFVTHFFLIFI